jgi:hypothetical protein
LSRLERRQTENPRKEEKIPKGEEEKKKRRREKRREKREPGNSRQYTRISTVVAITIT